MNGGHGHVIPRADGAKARCGGPVMCSVCAAELASEMAKPGGRGLYATVNEAIGAAVAAERERIAQLAEERHATCKRYEPCRCGVPECGAKTVTHEPFADVIREQP